MPRQMFDAVTPDNIPDRAEMVAGYIDHGPNPADPNHPMWTSADFARFPDAVHVSIAVLSVTNDGHVLDVENGDATPEQAVAWVNLRRSAGADPTVYCSLDAWPTVREAFHVGGVAEPHYWVAWWNNDPAMIDGAVAHQYGGTNGYDVSTVADFWPGVDGPGAPAPAPADPGVTYHGLPMGRVAMSDLVAGSTGSEVADVQRILGTAQDGVYGPQTEGAVRAFQAWEHLAADGVVGPVTWTALAQLKVGAGIDGVYGPETTAKVAAWQRDHGLTVDGIAGPRTFATFGPPPGR